jgi:hypothetical protein
LCYKTRVSRLEPASSSLVGSFETAESEACSSGCEEKRTSLSTWTLSEGFLRRWNGVFVLILRRISGACNLDAEGGVFGEVLDRGTRPDCL